jgi:hypothetical protein
MSQTLSWPTAHQRIPMVLALFYNCATNFGEANDVLLVSPCHVVVSGFPRTIRTRTRTHHTSSVACYELQLQITQTQHQISLILS